jgi:hypothetical protein
MEVDYITKDDTIIFTCKFNKLLDSELLSHYKKIIFSDYELNDSLGLFEAYENKKFHNDDKCIKSLFNQCLNNSLNNLSSLTHLTFGCNFNQSLGNSLHNLTSLTHLTFGYYFNQPLDNSLDNLTSLSHLTFAVILINPWVILYII